MVDEGEVPQRFYMGACDFVNFQSPFLFSLGVFSLMGARGVVDSR